MRELTGANEGWAGDTTGDSAESARGIPESEGADSAEGEDEVFVYVETDAKRNRGRWSRAKMRHYQTMMMKLM